MQDNKFPHLTIEHQRFTKTVMVARYYSQILVRMEPNIPNIKEFQGNILKRLMSKEIDTRAFHTAIKDKYNPDTLKRAQVIIKDKEAEIQKQLVSLLENQNKKVGDKLELMKQQQQQKSAASTAGSSTGRDNLVGSQGSGRPNQSTAGRSGQTQSQPAASSTGAANRRPAQTETKPKQTQPKKRPLENPTSKNEVTPAATKKAKVATGQAKVAAVKSDKVTPTAGVTAKTGAGRGRGKGQAAAKTTPSGKGKATTASGKKVGKQTANATGSGAAAANVTASSTAATVKIKEEPKKEADKKVKEEKNDRGGLASVDYKREESVLNQMVEAKVSSQPKIKFSGVREKMVLHKELLGEIMKEICKIFDLKNIREECLSLLDFAVQERLKNIISDVTKNAARRKIDVEKINQQFRGTTPYQFAQVENTRKVLDGIREREKAAKEKKEGGEMKVNGQDGEDVEGDGQKKKKDKKGQLARKTDLDAANATLKAIAPNTKSFVSNAANRDAIDPAAAKRINMGRLEELNQKRKIKTRDVLYYMQNDRRIMKSPVLYTAYLKE
mmetsp:Transcript_45222/g.51965  ORF Transcript_45222/g.51965 Transcript_45222/m.51965 type:complete len:555 (+) Transcript_45222:173-1837(+)